MDNDVINDQIEKKLFDAFRNKNIKNAKFGGRKFSTPAALNIDRLQPPLLINKRRFSNVGDAVSRKLSTTIGWRTSFPPSQEVILSGRMFCLLYIRHRLKRSRLFSRKIGLSRPRIMIGSPLVYENVIKEVFPCLNHACMEMERLHPSVYSNIARQLSCLDKMDDIREIMVALGNEIFTTEQNWGKVIALFCIAGGLSIDCVKYGFPENVNKICDAMAELMEDRVAEWVSANGGWMGLTTKCKREIEREISFIEYSGLFLLVLVILVISYFLMNSLLKYIM